MADTNKQVKKEVKDLLNQIIILIDGVELTDQPMIEDDYGGSEMIDEDSDAYNATDAFLEAVRDYAKRVIKNEDNATYNERQYYNSNCY